MKAIYVLLMTGFGLASAQDLMIQELDLAQFDTRVKNELGEAPPVMSNRPGWVQARPSTISQQELNALPQPAEPGVAARGMAAFAANSPAFIQPPPQDLTWLDETAKSLENDPAAVYDFVRRTCGFSLYPGLSKGPVRTLLDRTGNDLDLAVLLAALLERCPSAQNVVVAFGNMSLPLTDASAWLRVPVNNVSDQLSKAIVHHNLAEGGRISVEHFWVRAQIGGVTVNLDPSLQMHSPLQARMTKQGLVSAAGFDVDDLIAASSPNVVNQVELKSMSVAAVKLYLDNCRSQLATHPAFSDRRFGAQDILPGWVKQDKDASFVIPSLLPANGSVTYELGQADSVGVPLTWSWNQLPRGLKATVEYGHAEWSTSEGGIRWNTADIAERQIGLRVAGASAVAGGAWVTEHDLANGRTGLTLKSESTAQVRYYTQFEDMIAYAGTPTMPATPRGWWIPVFGYESSGEFQLVDVNVLSGSTNFFIPTDTSPEYDGANKVASFLLGFDPPQAAGTAVSGSVSFKVARGSQLYGPYTINVSGRSTASPLELKGKHFGVVQLRPDAMPAQEAICSVTNADTRPVAIQSVRVSAGPFSVVTNDPFFPVGGVIAANATKQIKVRYKPTTAAAHSAKLFVKVKNADNVITEEWVALRGIGYDPGKAELLVDGQVVAGGSGDVVLPDLQNADLYLAMRCPAFYQFAGVAETPNQSWVRAQLEAVKSGGDVRDHFGLSGITTHTYRLQRAGRFVIPIDFGSSDNGQFLARVGKRLQKEQSQPDSNEKDEAVLMSTLEMMGLSWFQQTNQGRHFFERTRHNGNSLGSVVIHRAGVVAQEFKTSQTNAGPAGYYVDVANQLESVGLNEPGFVSDAYVMSAMEHGVLEQMQRGSKASSTTRMLEKVLLLTGTNKPSIFRLNNSNFSQYQGRLSGYDPNWVQSFQGNLGMAGPQSWLLLPSNGSVALDTAAGWKGYGAVMRLQGIDGNALQESIGMLISGGYNGGYSGTPTAADAALLLELAQSVARAALESPPQPASTEPINLVTGEYYFDRTDISIGQADVRGVSFARHYTSAQAYSPGPLGYGWTHNWDGGVGLITDTSIAFGSRTTLDAVTAYVASMALDDLFLQDNVTNMTLAALVANWCVDSMKNNVAKVNVGNNSLTFSNHTNGMGPFYPPPGVTDELERTAVNAYRLTSRDGRITEFKNIGSGVTARSALSKLINPDGLATTLTYTGVLLTKVVDTNGRGITLLHDSSGLLTKITTTGDTAARTVSFQYDNPATTKNLKRIVDPAGRSTSHEYANPDSHLMTGLRDGLGRVIAINEYDSQNRAVRQWSYGHDEKEWNYLFSGLRTVEVDPAGGRTTYYFDDQMRTIARRDQMGNLRRTEYDFNNFPVLITDAEGHKVQTLYDRHLRPYRVNYYHPDENMNDILDPYHSEQFYDDDASGAPTRHRPTLSISRGGKPTLLEYNVGNNKFRPDRVKVFQALGDANPRTTHYTYHTAGKQVGQVATITDPAERVTTLAYDALGAPASVTREVEVDTGSGTQLVPMKTRTVFNARGDLTDSYDERGIRTQTLYNDARQPVSVTSAFGTSYAYTVTTQYDDAGDAVQTFDSMPVPYRAGQTFSAQGKPLRSYRITQNGTFDTTLSGNNYASEQLYDVRDWPVQMNFLAPSGIPWKRISTVTVPYADGRPFQTTSPLDTDGEPLQQTDTPHRTVSFASSPEKSISSVTDDAGFRVITATDVAARQKRVSDAFDATTVSDPLQLPANVLRLNYQHKPDGELLTLTNRRNKTYTMGYDGYGQMQSRVTPGERATGYTYTPDGLPQTLTRPDNSVISWGYYPESGRLHTQTDPAGTIEHRYDVSGNLTWVRDQTTGSTLSSSYNNVGRIQTFTDSRGQQTRYTWQNNGLLRSVRYHAQRAAAKAAAASATINSGAVTALALSNPGMGYPGAPVVSIAPPPAASGGTTATAEATVVDGVVTNLTITNPGSGYTAAPTVAIALPPPDLVVTYDYYPDRSLAKVTDWTGRATIFKYYQDGKLHSIERPNKTTRTFAYTLAGELALVAEGTKNDPAHPVIHLAKFAYNNRGHVSLKSSFPGEPENATSTPPMAVQEVGDDNELKIVNNQPQTHDARGNLTHGVLPGGVMGTEVVTYTFDARNRLTAMEGGHGFGYDVGNSRISITTGGVTTELSVAPLGGMSQLITEKPAGGAGAERAYIYTPQGQLLYHLDPDTSVAVAPSSLTGTYYHYDITGSTVALSGEDGLVKGRISYTAYGEITSRTGSTDTRFLFCGAYGVQTDASGLVYMRARYYHPYLCRFLNEDPVEFGGGMNWFAYASGNPLRLVDPNGHEAVSTEQSQRWVGEGGWFPHSSVYVNVPVIDPVTGKTQMGYYRIEYGPTLPFVQMVVDNTEAMNNSSGWEFAGRLVGQGAMLLADAVVGAAHGYAMVSTGGTTIGEVYITSLPDYVFYEQLRDGDFQKIDASQAENVNLVNNVNAHIANGQQSTILYNVLLNNSNQFARQATGNGMQNPPVTNAVYIPYTNIDINPAPVNIPYRQVPVP